MCSIFDYPGVIEYERPETWPSDLMRLLEVEFACLRDYELRRAEIDDDCRIHLMARINVPHNSHKAARDAWSFVPTRSWRPVSC
jgi:hypothetical protein